MTNKRKRGRPHLTVAGVSRSVYLYPEEVRAAEILGDGNFSLGVKIAIRDASNLNSSPDLSDSTTPPKKRKPRRT